MAAGIILLQYLRQVSVPTLGARKCRPVDCPPIYQPCPVGAHRVASSSLRFLSQHHGCSPAPAAQLSGGADATLKGCRARRALSARGRERERSREAALDRRRRARPRTPCSYPGAGEERPGEGPRQRSRHKQRARQGRSTFARPAIIDNMPAHQAKHREIWPVYGPRTLSNGESQ